MSNSGGREDIWYKSSGFLSSCRRRPVSESWLKCLTDPSIILHCRSEYSAPGFQWRKIERNFYFWREKRENDICWWIFRAWFLGCLLLTWSVLWSDDRHHQLHLIVNFTEHYYSSQPGLCNSDLQQLLSLHSFYPARLCPATHGWESWTNLENILSLKFLFENSW